MGYVGEFYGSTEGNATLVNTMNKVGACGYLPWVTTLVYPVHIVRLHGAPGSPTPASTSTNSVSSDALESGVRDASSVDSAMEPVRDADGLCVECLPGEPGELVGKIVRSDPLRQWSGYSTEEETRRKVLTDVFAHGDEWFRSGDLMVKDADGFITFVDRLGDTFRWKGENCACSQVEEVVMATGLVEDAVVYGVTVPGCDGHAGMAFLIPHASNATAAHAGASAGAIQPSSQQASGVGAGIDTALLYNRLSKQLASWQMPVFLRTPAPAAAAHNNSAAMAAVTGAAPATASAAHGAGTGTGTAASLLTVTATFKHNKTALQRAGFELFNGSKSAGSGDAAMAVGDTVWVRDDAAKRYVVLTQELYDDLHSGKLRL